MERVDRMVGWVIFGIGALHCAVTFLLFPGYSDSAIWFFSGGLAMLYCAALNLLRVQYFGSAPGVRRVSFAANLSLLAFIVVYAAGKGPRILRNPGALVLIACAVAATAFSLLRRPAADESELRP